MSRRGYIIAATIGVLTIVAVSVVPVAPKLIWNASASTPIGLYLIRPVGRVEVTDIVAVDAPEPLAAFLEQRGYLTRGVPLLKRVVGLPGQRVCRIGRTITVDRRPMGAALDRDRRGRELPVWRGCRRIATGEVFLMNRQVRDSLDGRYFGPLPAASVIGRATPLYTDEDGDGRFVWRAPTR
jgi:conjugative transfer signal peptidase TraF